MKTIKLKSGKVIAQLGTQVQSPWNNYGIPNFNLEKALESKKLENPIYNTIIEDDEVKTPELYTPKRIKNPNYIDPLVAGYNTVANELGSFLQNLNYNKDMRRISLLNKQDGYTPNPSFYDGMGHIQNINPISMKSGGCMKCGGSVKLKSGRTVMQKGGKIVDPSGYLKSNLNNFTPVKVIEGDANGTNITTQGLAFPIIANGKQLFPNTGEYHFNESKVVETPLKLSFGKTIMQKGGFINKAYEKLYNVYTKAGFNVDENLNNKTVETEEETDTEEEITSKRLPVTNLNPSSIEVKGDLKDRIKYAKDLYKSIGLTDIQSASIIGNLVQESNLKPLDYGDRDSKGVAQWRTDRFNNLVKWSTDNKMNPADLKTQLLFVVEEAKSRKSKFNKNLTDLDIAGIGDVSTATINFGRSYERPSEKHANWKRRVDHAALTLNV